MKAIHWRTLTVGVFVTALALGVSVRNSFGGKPKPTPLPAIKYQIHFWDVPNPGGAKYLNEMNNLGQAVGWYVLPSGEKHGYFYDPTSGSNTAVDLNEVAAPPAGWVIASATSINDRGAITGYLEPVGSSDDPNFRMGFVLDMAAEIPTLLPLPDAQWSYALGISINENGDVAGVYKTNDGGWGVYFCNSGLYAPADPTPVLLGPNVKNPSYLCLNNPVGDRPAQIAGTLAAGTTAYGTAFRWTPGQTLETFPELESPLVFDINDSSTFCGQVRAKLPRKPEGRYVMRFNTSLNLLSASSESAVAINAAGDLATGRSLYHDSWGFLNPNDLIDLADPDAAIWFSGSSFDLEDLNQRDDATGFGQVVGRLRFADGSSTFFLLTPVPSP